MNDIALKLIDVFFWVAAVPAILFPTLYFFRSPWRSTIIGKMMMAKSSALGLVFLLSILFRFIPNFPGKLWLAVLAYAYLGVAIWAQTIILLGIQQKRALTTMPRREPSDGPAH